MLKIKRVHDLGLQFTENPHRMVGQDGAFSIPLNGETLWFFGDTLIGTRVPGESLWYPGGQWIGPGDMTGKATYERMLNNSGLLLPRQTGKGGLKNFRYICDEQGQLRPLISLLEHEDPDWIRVWCLHGIRIEKKIYLYFIKVQMLKDGPLPANFEIIGSGLAVGSTHNWQFRRIFHLGNDILWPVGQPHFATAILRHTREDWLYAYGVKKDETGRQNCYLARVRPADIEQLEAYEYLIGRQPVWGASVTEAIPLFEGMPNELSVSFNPYLNAYLAVHSFGTDGRIVGRTAPEPWGPWSKAQLIWTVQVSNGRPIPYQRLIYAAKEHPSLADGSGRIIYITYIEFEEYYPHLLEVHLG